MSVPTDWQDEIALEEATLHSLVKELTGRLVGALIPDGVSLAVVLVDTLNLDPAKPHVFAVAHGNNEALNQRIPELLIADVNRK